MAEVDDVIMVHGDDDDDDDGGGGGGGGGGVSVGHAMTKLTLDDYNLDDDADDEVSCSLHDAKTSNYSVNIIK